MEEEVVITFDICTCTVAVAVLMLDAGPLGLSFAVTVKRLYFESTVPLNGDVSEMSPVSEVIENFGVSDSE